MTIFRKLEVLPNWLEVVLEFDSRLTWNGRLGRRKGTAIVNNSSRKGPDTFREWYLVASFTVVERRHLIDFDARFQFD